MALILCFEPKRCLLLILWCLVLSSKYKPWCSVMWGVCACAGARVGPRGRDAGGGAALVAGQRRRVLHTGEVRLLTATPPPLHTYTTLVSFKNAHSTHYLQLKSHVQSRLINAVPLSPFTASVPVSVCVMSQCTHLT